MPGAFYNDSRAWQKFAVFPMRFQQTEPSAVVRQAFPHSFHARESSIRPQRKLLRSSRLKKSVIAVAPLDKRIVTTDKKLYLQTDALSTQKSGLAWRKTETPT